MVHTDLAEPDMQSKGASLRRLVGDARRGDERAWDELVMRYAGLVWAVARAYRLSEADAADAAQATWLKLLEHLGNVNDPTALGAWLTTTTRRECLHILRKGARVDLREDPREVADSGPGVDAGLLTSEREANLWCAFSRLRPSDQALLRMLAADPAPSYEEIGGALDMPVGSIGPTRARALERLRREVDLLGVAAVETLR